jgi:hypothetical protein
MDMAKRHIDRLDPRVLAFSVSEDGQFEMTSAERKDDVTPVVNYPRYSANLAPTDTLSRSKMG